MRKEIQVIFKAPGCTPWLRKIPNELGYIQNVIGGYIEVTRCAWDDELLVIVDEEGKLWNKAPNIWNGPDLLVGNVLFVRQRGDEFASVDEADLEYLMGELPALEYDAEEISYYYDEQLETEDPEDLLRRFLGE